MDILRIWMLRLGSGNSSRESLFMSTVELQFRSGVFGWLFGHGYNAVMIDSGLGLSSHCDYLEILYDFGVFSEILFISILWQIWKQLRTLKKYNKYQRDGCLAALVIFAVASIPSHMLTYSTYFLVLAFFFGYSQGQLQMYQLPERESIAASR